MWGPLFLLLARLLPRRLVQDFLFDKQASCGCGEVEDVLKIHRCEHCGSRRCHTCSHFAGGLSVCERCVAQHAEARSSS